MPNNKRPSTSEDKPSPKRSNIVRESDEQVKSVGKTDSEIWLEEMRELMNSIYKASIENQKVKSKMEKTIQTGFNF